MAQTGGFIKAAAENRVIGDSSRNCRGLVVVVMFWIAYGVSIGHPERQVLAWRRINRSHQPFFSRVLHVAVAAVHDFAFVADLGRALFCEIPVAGYLNVLAVVAERR